MNDMVERRKGEGIMVTTMIALLFVELSNQNQYTECQPFCWTWLVNEPYPLRSLEIGYFFVPPSQEVLAR